MNVERRLQRAVRGLAGAVALVASVNCGSGGSSAPQKCVIAEGAAAPDSLRQTGCLADFLAISSPPLDSTIPGARSGKVILDTFDGKMTDQLYFQNSVKYQIHYQFASKFLTGPDHIIVT